MMNKEQAINVLINVAHMAQKGGLISLQDAPVVSNAVSVLLQKEKPEVVAKTVDKKAKVKAKK